MIRQTVLACTFTLFSLFAYLAMANETSNPADAVRMCVDECLAFYEKPSAELKQCVSNCSRLAEPSNTTESARPLTPVSANQ